MNPIVHFELYEYLECFYMSVYIFECSLFKVDITHPLMRIIPERTRYSQKYAIKRMPHDFWQNHESVGSVLLLKHLRGIWGPTEEKKNHGPGSFSHNRTNNHTWFVWPAFTFCHCVSILLNQIIIKNDRHKIILLHLTLWPTTEYKSFAVWSLIIQKT